MSSYKDTTRRSLRLLRQDYFRQFSVLEASMQGYDYYEWHGKSMEIMVLFHTNNLTFPASEGTPASEHIRGRLSTYLCVIWLVCSGYNKKSSEQKREDYCEFRAESGNHCNVEQLLIGLDQCE